jgi:hypothetical protein
LPTLHNGDVIRAAAAMERSLQWRRRYRFLPQGDLRRFEDVVFVHGRAGYHRFFSIKFPSFISRLLG